MGSSSGSGSFVFGGSLSSSTLSPLAPPFNFDKTNQKPNLTNPSVNMFEGPVYSSVFDPIGPFWKSTSSPPASVPSYVVPDSTVANTSCPTSPGIYSYQVPPYTDPRVTCDPFSYTHFQNSMSTSVDENAKPYYLPYVYPPPVKDGCVELSGVKGSGYDLFSNSDTANCTGFGSSSIDHTQGLSVGGDPKPKWGDIWIGVNDGEHSEWKEYAQGFGSNGNGFSGLFGNKSHLPVDGSSQIHLFSETSNECLLKQGSHISQGLDCLQNISTDAGSFYDIFGGGYPTLSLGIGQQDYQSTFDLKLGGVSAACSKLPAFASVSTSDENPHLQKPVLESVASFCGPQTTTVTKDCSSQTGSFVFNCSPTTGTPISMSKLPYEGSKFTAQSTILGTKVNRSDVVHKSIPFTGCDSSSQKEPQFPPGLKSRSSIVIKRPHSSLMDVEPSSTQIGETGNRSVNKDASDKPKSTPIVPHQFNLDVFAREVADAEVIFSAEKHIGEGDVHNPAEDSPCWKGASSTHFSPFGVSDSVVSDAEGTLCKTSRVDDSHSIDLYVQDINGSISVKKPSSACTSKDCEGSSLMSQKPHLFDLNDGAEVNHVIECQVSSEKSDELKARIAGISSAITQWVLEYGDPSAEAEKNKDRTHIEAYIPSSVPFVIGNGICSSPQGDNSSFNFCQSPKNVSESRIDISMWLKTMMNMSEELRAYCLNNPAAAMQRHSKTIRHIINNLSNCISMIDAPLLVSSQGSSFQEKLPVSEMVSTSESVAAAVKLSRRTEEFLESFPFKDDSIILGNDNNMAEAKKILLENINEEEMEQHKLLYKNLWLEAEAALCAMTVKARLHHMKMEMEKACATTKEVGRPPGSGISSDVQSVRESTSKDKDSPTLVVHDCSSLRTTTTIATTGQCEVSVINKFHIPNSQVSLNLNKCEGLKSTTRDLCVLPLQTNDSYILDNNCDDSGTINDGDDFATSVTARYQILKDRIDPCDYEGQLSQGGEHNFLLEKEDSNLENSHADVETSTLARYHIIKCRDDKADSLEEFYVPDVLSDTDRPFQNPQLLNSFSGTDDGEASVMGRLCILQNRMNCLNAMDKDPTPEQSRMPATNDATQGQGWSNQVGQSLFGAYPNFSNYDNVKREAAASQGLKANNLRCKIVEEWYASGYPSSEWEHVSKEDLQRQL